MVAISELMSDIDIEALREKVRVATPFPHFCVDNFLKPEFAHEVVQCYPDLKKAQEMGKAFNAVNEKGKVQVTDSKLFAPPVKKLEELLASQPFLDMMSYVMDIPNLVADPELHGGGMHQTGPRGHLDVHVDFNYIEKRKLHRRLNILIYLNEGWQPGWGGEIELWDQDVQNRVAAFSPIFNRCVVFETNEISFHGVTAVTCPPDTVRRSFAAYYYTHEAPKHWNGVAHSTIFRARPTERFKKYVAMPIEQTVKGLRNYIASGIKKVAGGKLHSKEKS